MENLVLFDIDGTLMKESPTHTYSFEYVCEKVYGVKVDAFNFPRHGMTDRGIIYGLLRNGGLSDDEIKQKINDAINLMGSYFVENIKEYDYELLPGVIDLLGSLSSLNIKIGVITGNIKAVANARLEKAGILKFFTTGAYGDEDTVRSNLVKLAVKRAGQNIYRVFVVGDTPLDIEAAIQADTIPVGVATGKYGINELENAELKLQNFNYSEINRFISYIKKE